MEIAAKCELTLRGVSHLTEPYPVMCTTAILKLPETCEQSRAPGGGGQSVSHLSKWSVLPKLPETLLKPCSSPIRSAGLDLCYYLALVQFGLVSAFQRCLTDLYFQMVLRAQESSWETVANSNHPTRLDEASQDHYQASTISHECHLTLMPKRILVIS